jgi:hypothetical protein
MCHLQGTAIFAEMQDNSQYSTQLIVERHFCSQIYFPLTTMNITEVLEAAILFYV